MDKLHFHTRTHLIIDDENDLNPEVEDIGKESIRIVYSEGGHNISLTLGEIQALKLAQHIIVYFQDKNR